MTQQDRDALDAWRWEQARKEAYAAEVSEKVDWWVYASDEYRRLVREDARPCVSQDNNNDACCQQNPVSLTSNTDPEEANGEVVAWMYSAEREEPFVSVKRWPPGVVEAQCWTETPLYAHPLKTVPVDILGHASGAIIALLAIIDGEHDYWCSIGALNSCICDKQTALQKARSCLDKLKEGRDTSLTPGANHAD